MGCGASKPDEVASSSKAPAAAPAATLAPPAVEKAPSPPTVKVEDTKAAQSEKASDKNSTITGGALSAKPLKQAWGEGEDTRDSFPAATEKVSKSTTKPELEVGSAKEAKDEDLNGYEPEYEKPAKQTVIGRPFTVTGDMTVKAPSIGNGGGDNNEENDSINGDDTSSQSAVPLTDVEKPKAGIHDKLKAFIEDPDLVDLNEDETLHDALDLKDREGPSLRSGGRSFNTGNDKVNFQPIENRLEMQEATVSGFVRPNLKKNEPAPGTFEEPSSWKHQPEFDDPSSTLPEIQPRKAHQDPDWLVGSGGSLPNGDSLPPYNSQDEILSLSADTQTFQITGSQPYSGGQVHSRAEEDVLSFDTFGRHEKLPAAKSSHGVDEEELKLLMGEEYDGPLKTLKNLEQELSYGGESFGDSDSYLRSTNETFEPHKEERKSRVTFDDASPAVISDPYDRVNSNMSANSSGPYPNFQDKFKEALEQEEEQLKKQIEGKKNLLERKSSDPWANIQGQYQIERAVETPKAIPAQFQRPLTAEIGEEGEYREVLDDQMEPEGVVLWDGVQPISNVAESEWQPVEDLNDEDYDSVYGAIPLPQPSVRHIEHGYDDKQLLGLGELDSHDGSQDGNRMTEDELLEAEEYMGFNDQGAIRFGRIDDGSPRMSVGRAITPEHNYTSFTHTPDHEPSSDVHGFNEVEQLAVEDIDENPLESEEWKHPPPDPPQPVGLRVEDSGELYELNDEPLPAPVMPKKEATAGRRAKKPVSEIQPYDENSPLKMNGHHNEVDLLSF